MVRCRARKCSYPLTPNSSLLQFLQSLNQRAKEASRNMLSTKEKLRLTCTLGVLAIAALGVSCTGFFPPEQIGSITITPSTANVPLGGTTQLVATGTNTDSTPAGDITGKVSWSSSSGSVSVNSTGKLTGNDLSSSAATITAEYQGVSATASATVCVENGTNFTITLSPASPVTANTSVSATAFATVSGISGPVDISGGVQWSTSNSTEVPITNGDPATIDTSGVTSPVTVTIFATYTCNGVNNSFQTNLTVN